MSAALITVAAIALIVWIVRLTCDDEPDNHEAENIAEALKRKREQS